MRTFEVAFEYSRSLIASIGRFPAYLYQSDLEQPKLRRWLRPSLAIYLPLMMTGPAVADNSVRYTYDQLGRVSKIEDGIGITNAYQYDSNGNVIQHSTAPSATGGGPGLFSQIMSAPPQASALGFTNWINQGVATETDVPLGMLLTNGTTGGNANNWNLLCASAPSTPYTRTALMSYFNPAMGQYNSVGLHFYNSTTGRMEGVDFQQNAPTGSANPEYVILTQKWGSPTQYSSTPSGNVYVNTHFFWVRVTNDGTNLGFYTSMDGEFWYEMYNETISGGWFSGGAPDSICFGVNLVNGAPLGATLLSYQ